MVESGDNREEILAAALCQLEEGIAVLDVGSRVLFWNPTAEAITGYLSADLLSRTLPADAYEIDPQHHAAHTPHSKAVPGTQDNGGPAERPLLVILRHKQGHSLPAMLRRTPLRDALGKRFGTLLRFHPVEEIDTLPHGAAEEDSARENRVESSQADMEERLDDAWQEWHGNAVPFGLLWIMVDQAAMLRKTHGRDAADAMLGIVERTLLHGLKPTEILGRWGTHEFLVLCHERTTEMLDAHAHRLGSLAQTADFRWWGDRVSLTVSIGAAHAAEDESLRCLLLRAQRGMQESIYLGGNHIVSKAFKGGRECSQS
jgi:diguanylate cyclase (GGDEF)-like protein/PAS domain S-box-containing protein